MKMSEKLTQVYTLDRKKRVLMEKKKKMRELLDELSGYSVEKTPRRYLQYKETAEKIHDYEAQIDEKIGELVEKRIEAEEIIASVPNSTQREVLERRYLFNQPWETYYDRSKGRMVTGIADEMHYSVRQVYRYHKAAMEYLEKMS